MDGNGRWARARDLPRIEGHRQGVQNVLRIIDAAAREGIEYLTLYAFSVENWQRPPEEVDALMHLLEIFLQQYAHELIERQVRLRVIGDISMLPEHARRPLEKTLQDTAHFSAHTLVLAINYGARAEIVRAVQDYARDVQESRARPENLDWSTLANYLSTAGIPDPDLIIRSSGEKRLSNFLLLQAAYAEIYFTPVLWPDFDGEELAAAIHFFSQRERRFGKTGEQLHQS